MPETALELSRKGSRNFEEEPEEEDDDLGPMPEAALEESEMEKEAEDKPE